MTTDNLTELSFIRRFFLKLNIALPLLPAKPPAHEPSYTTLFLLSGLIGVPVLLHFSIAKLSIAFLALFIFLLKLGFLARANKQKTSKTTPPQVITILLTIIAFGLIILMYGGWNGQRSGISFIVVLGSLKFLESRVLRDYYVVCLILLFLGASSFLFNSSIFNICCVLIYTVAITGVMLKLSCPSPIHFKASLSTSTSIIAKALPIALLLFFFFPRIHGNFGFFPNGDTQFDSELSNSLVAGDIASSAFNNQLAFRVEFEDAIPQKNQLYWRSKVMTVEDNFSWVVNRPSTQASSNARIKLDTLEERAKQADLTRYSVLHEESSDLFVPYLDFVTEFSHGRFNDDFSVWRRPRTNSFRYTGASMVTSNITETSQLNIEKLLETISVPSARTQALLSIWQQESADPMKLAQQVLDHFTNNEFFYSLYPPGLDDFPVDEFLFNTKTGYCEHYASLFTILMRWMGVPARVVAGYQGGLANQSGQYLEIRYSDAHAWSEILVDQTWVRVDPTAAISPDRIEFGMDAFMSLWDSAGMNGISGGSALSDYLNPKGMDRYYRMLRDNWNNIGYQWKKWVVDYDADTQQELLAKLGIEGANRYGILVLIMFGSIGAILLFYFWRLLPKRLKRAEAQQLYLRFIDRFKKFDVVKNPADTPYEFAQKAIKKYPEQQQQISDVTNAYVQLRYGKESFDLSKFKQLVTQFKLKN